MDQTKHILRKTFGQDKKDDQIKGVPRMKTLQDIFKYVSEEYFSPPLGPLEAYEYPSKYGHGEPLQISLGTTLAQVRRRQKDRHVPDDRHTIITKADLNNCFKCLPTIPKFFFKIAHSFLIR